MRGGFEQIIELNLKRFSPEAAKQHHIRIAKEILNAYISRQQEPVDYQIFTDGVPSSTENSVRPYGVIRYLFTRMAAVGRFAIATARDYSPVRSGRYQKSWILVADGVQVSENDIPNSVQQLILINIQPYARKIHTRGARLRWVPPGIVERVRQQILRRFKIVKVELRFIHLHGGYVLKKDYVQVRRSGRLRLREKAGSELSYPALVISPKFG